MQRRAVEGDPAGMLRDDSKDRLRHIGSSRADQPRNTENLAAADFEADAGKSAFAAQILDPQPRLADRHGWLVEELSQLPADHHADDLFLAGLGDVARANAMTISQHGDAIRYREDLFEP